MAKLRDERFLCPGGFNSDSAAYLDVLTVKQLSNGACHSILFKLMLSILRHESSEALRRRYGSQKDDIFCCKTLLISSWPSFFILFSANMHCYLAIFSIVNIFLIQMSQSQFCNSCFLTIKRVKISISIRCPALQPWCNFFTFWWLNVAILLTNPFCLFY